MSFLFIDREQHLFSSLVPSSVPSLLSLGPALNDRRRFEDLSLRNAC